MMHNGTGVKQRALDGLYKKSQNHQKKCKYRNLEWLLLLEALL